MPTREQFLEMCHAVRRILERHWLKAAWVGSAVTILTLIGALLMPRSYYSEARLFIRFGRENQVDPTATSGQMVSLYESRESEINSLIEILKSRTILDQVVAALGPNFVLWGKPKPAASSTAAAKATPPQPPSRAHQRAVAQLEREIAIASPRRSNIITVSCKASTPAIAQQIVAKLVEVYQEEHLRVHKTSGSLEFFQDQTAQALAAWRAACDQLRDEKNRIGIVTIEGERKKLEDQIADIESKLLANQSDLKTSQAKLQSLQGLLASLPEKIVTQEAQGPSAAFDGMRQALYLLEAQEQEMAGKMHETHPKLLAVRQLVRDQRQILENQPEERVQVTEALNPARQALQLSFLSESSQAESLRARERSLISSREQLHRQLEQLNSHVIGIEQLQRQVALTEANHKDYALKLEQARMSQSLDEERISSISVVQPASYVPTAIGPRRKHVLAAGFMLAVLSSLATTLVAAWLNPLITSAEQLAAVLEMPLAGVVPSRRWAG